MYLGDAVSTATDPNNPASGNPGDALPDITVSSGGNSALLFILALLLLFAFGRE